MSADSSLAAGFGAQRHFEPDLHKLVMAGSACQSLAGAAKNTTIPVAGGTFVRVAHSHFMHSVSLSLLLLLPHVGQQEKEQCELGAPQLEQEQKGREQERQEKEAKEKQ